MPNNRYFFPQPFVLDQEIQLQDQEFHHLRHVCRSERGDEIELINGCGELATAIVCQISKENAMAKIILVRKEKPLSFEITLALAFLKPSHLEYAIEKATEVGVSTFWLFPGERSEKKEVSEQYLKRLHTIMQGATKQCGRLFSPQLYIKPNLSSCCLQDGPLLFGDFGPEAKPLSRVNLLASKTCLVIGPESGFSANERTMLFSLNAIPVSIHPHVLRAETAAVAGSLLLFNRFYS
jgi:16S rRNA (uracil1498-N3)-methyltransferase